VLVQLRNRAAAPAASVRIEGEWRGERARAFLAGPLSSGGFGEVRLHFIEPPPPGMHALVLRVDFVRVDGTAARRVHEVAALLLAFNAVPSPAVRVASAPVFLRESAEVEIRLESVDGAAHRVRLAVWPPRVLTCEPPVQTVEVPGHGAVFARVRVFRARAAPGSRHEFLAVAETVGETPTRSTVATLAAAVALENAWMRHLRIPLVLVALLCLTWSMYRQLRTEG
jgi:hypothetical protein